MTKREPSTAWADKELLLKGLRAYKGFIILQLLAAILSSLFLYEPFISWIILGVLWLAFFLAFHIARYYIDHIDYQEKFLDDRYLFLYIAALSFLTSLCLTLLGIAGILKLIFILPLLFFGILFFDKCYYFHLSAILTALEAALFFLWNKHIIYPIAQPKTISTEIILYPLKQWFLTLPIFAIILIVYSVIFCYLTKAFKSYRKFVGNEKQRVEQEKIQLKEYIDSLPIGIVIASPTLEIIVSNQKAKELLKLGRGFRDFKAILLRANVDEQILSSIISHLNKGMDYTINMLELDETTVLKVWFSPLRDKNGVLKNVIISMSDIGTEYFLNKRLNFYNKLLEMFISLMASQISVLNELVDAKFKGYSSEQILREICEEIKDALGRSSFLAQVYYASELTHEKQKELPEVVKKALKSNEFQCNVSEGCVAFPLHLGEYLESVIYIKTNEPLSPREISLLRDVHSNLETYFEIITTLSLHADRRYKDLEIISEITHIIRNKLALAMGIYSEIEEQAGEKPMMAVESSMTSDPLASVIALLNAVQTYARSIRYLFIDKKSPSLERIRLNDLFFNIFGIYKKFYESIKFSNAKFYVESEFPEDAVVYSPSKEKLSLIMHLMALSPLAATNFQNDIFVKLVKLESEDHQGFAIISSFKAAEQNIPFIIPFLTPVSTTLQLNETKVGLIMLIRLVRLLNGRVSIHQDEQDASKFEIKAEFDGRE
ncbi:MAG TPA: hypothetical protein ENG16_05015 [Archaeoglobus sp.]|nr:hypothetical protein [Archaeoglobus sp.]